MWIRYNTQTKGKKWPPYHLICYLCSHAGPTKNILMTESATQKCRNLVFIQFGFYRRRVDVENQTKASFRIYRENGLVSKGEWKMMMCRRPPARMCMDSSAICVWQTETPPHTHCYTHSFRNSFPYHTLTCTRASQPHHSRWWREEVWAALGSREGAHVTAALTRISTIQLFFFFFLFCNTCFFVSVCLSRRMWQAEERRFPELAVLLSGSHLFWQHTVHQQPAGWWGRWQWQEGAQKHHRHIRSQSSRCGHHCVSTILNGCVDAHSWPIWCWFSNMASHSVSLPSNGHIGKCTSSQPIQNTLQAGALKRTASVDSSSLVDTVLIHDITFYGLIE